MRVIASVPEQGLSRWEARCLQELARSGSHVVCVPVPVHVRPTQEPLLRREGFFGFPVDLGTTTADVLIRFCDRTLDVSVGETWTFALARRECIDPEAAVRDHPLGEPLELALCGERENGSLRVLHSSTLISRSKIADLRAILNEAPELVRRARAGLRGSELEIRSLAKLRSSWRTAPGRWRRQARRLQQRIKDRISIDEWRLGILNAPVSALLDQSNTAPIRWMPLPPKLKFAADPFAICRGRGLEIAFEAVDRGDVKGYLAVATEAQLTRGEFDVLLRRDTHLSYPFAFHHEGKVFIIPESFEACEVVLHELGRDNQLTRVAVLLQDIPACDATIVQHAGRFWMFATREDRGPHERLFVFHAPELKGPWTAHAHNPVKCDARSARPAGVPFVHRGALYRPAQDCSRTYGGRISLMRVDELDTDKFSERLVRTIEPERPQADGLHTMSVGPNGVVLFDGKRRVFARKLSALVGR